MMFERETVHVFFTLEPAMIPRVSCSRTTKIGTKCDIVGDWSVRLGVPQKYGQTCGSLTDVRCQIRRWSRSHLGVGPLSYDIPFTKGT